MNTALIAKTACEVHHASQEPGELARALDLVGERREVIVEIGCDRGGTLWAWRQVCPTVLGITTADNSGQTGGSGDPLMAHGALVLVGDSHEPATYDWLVGVLDGRPVDLLVIDGDHSVAGVRADFAVYSPLVRDGGLVLLHDIDVVTDARAHVHEVWPGIAGDWPTSEIRGRLGWGVVHVKRAEG